MATGPPPGRAEAALREDSCEGAEDQGPDSGSIFIFAISSHECHPQVTKEGSQGHPWEAQGDLWMSPAGEGTKVQGQTRRCPGPQLSYGGAAGRGPDQKV